MKRSSTAPKTPAGPPYWAQSAEDLFTGFASGIKGLSTAEASARLSRVGRNVLAQKKRVSWPGAFLNQFKSPIILILLFATGVSAFVGDWIDAVIIFAIVVGSAILSFVQEHRASAAIEKLRSRVAVKSNVIRDGEARQLPAEEVVPGDVILLSAGSLVPADGVVLEARDFFISQAVLTGETYPVEKEPGLVGPAAGLSERTNCVFMGTSARSGSARVLVTETGPQTIFGGIAEKLTLRPPETEFERGIRHLGFLLSEVMLLLVIGVFAINVFSHKPPIDSLLFSLALAVGLTPQLLPAIININLSKGSQSMAAHGVIVRRLASIENFGSMDVLCTDKTGTLTVGVVALDGTLDPRGEHSPEVLRLAFLNATLQTGLVNPLDEAIATTGKAAGLAVDPALKLDEAPYDFVRKRLSVVVGGPDGPQIITKGAFEKVVEVCTMIEAPDDAAVHESPSGSTAPTSIGPHPSASIDATPPSSKTVPLDPARRSALDQLYSGWSAKGFRVLGLAVKRPAPQPRYGREDETGMIFAGFLLFSIRPRRAWPRPWTTSRSSA